mgnify:FL=1
MYDNHDFNNYYNNYNQRPTRRKSKAATYIAIILVTAMISSLIAGAAVYRRFSDQLEKVALEAQNASAVSENLAQKLAAQNNTADNGAQTLAATNVNKLTTTAVTGGADVTAIAKKAGPSIVGIRMTVSGTRFNYYGISNDQTSEGSGIIYTEDGYIMTNYHVVSSADPRSGLSDRAVLEVFLPDGREAKAKFIGGDSKTDLALIKIDLNGLTAAEIGDSSKLEVGEPAVAIGNPLGMEFAGSVTAGVISALNRTVEVDGREMNFIQTDAAINSGNSGGALLNTEGQVIGINSVKVAASGVEGLGFAIPVNDAMPVIRELKMNGRVTGRPYIGISGEEISGVLSESYGIPKGIYITEVEYGSGAYEAGIRAEDILVSMDGKKVETLEELDKIKEAHKAGDTVNAEVYRDSKKISVKLTFGEEK